MQTGLLILLLLGGLALAWSRKAPAEGLDAEISIYEVDSRRRIEAASPVTLMGNQTYQLIVTVSNMSTFAGEYVPVLIDFYYVGVLIYPRTDGSMMLEANSVTEVVDIIFTVPDVDVDRSTEFDFVINSPTSVVVREYITIKASAIGYVITPTIAIS